jgi:long-subunit acyl-CoA synthetase (AMP-forming)
MNSPVPFMSPSPQLQGHLAFFDGREVKERSFTQLAKDVEDARARLKSSGLGPAALIGLIGENCYELIVWDLALLAEGCVAICFPVEEFAHKSGEDLADDFGLSLLLVTKRARRPGDHPWQSVINGDEPPTLRPRVVTDHPLRSRLRGTDCCTLIFSSGTSGKLKTLLLSKAGVDSTIDALANDWELSPQDGILVALPLSIFQQRLMVYAALRKDTRVLLTDSVNLFRSFKVLKPSIVLGPPALFEMIESRFLALPERKRRLLSSASRALAVVPNLAMRQTLRRRVLRFADEAFGGRVRALLTGSAASKASTLRFFELAGLPLFQAYGLAEVGFIAWNRPGQNRPLSVGHPVVAGSVLLAADGEILVSVPRPQALGYFGVDPAEEQLTFLPGGRVATGDLGRFDERGFLYITGRKKDLILTQAGQKIHPETLELELAATPGVTRAVVVGGGDLTGLVAIVAVEPQCSDELEARVRADVQGAITALNKRGSSAARIVRTIFTRVAFNPETGLITRNLKLDRRAVRRLFESQLTQGAGAVE